MIDGRLVTPPLSSGCLAGVTRDLVIEWCGAVEQDLTADDLAGAAEVFVTSSTRDVHPVHDLDGRVLAAPGPITAAAMADVRRQRGEGRRSVTLTFRPFTLDEYVAYRSGLADDYAGQMIEMAGMDPETAREMASKRRGRAHAA